MQNIAAAAGLRRARVPAMTVHATAVRPLWAIGFRPFYLCAGAFAAAAMALWTAQYAGWIRGVHYLSNPYWHAHEMIFGYALAVISGFLFTAVRNWTGLATPSGTPLVAIVLLWLTGRVLLATPWPLLSAGADLLFVIAVAAGIGVPLQRSGNRNRFFVPLLLLLGGANLAFHLAMRGELAVGVRDMLQLALNVVAFIMALMAGRVIPMFTANGVPGTQPQRRAGIERTALVSLMLLLVTDLSHAPPWADFAIAAVATVAHAWRLALWQPWRTRRTPIVWVLHAAYAWIVVYLALRTLGTAGLVPPAIAIHALTVGALGGLTLGMMTRTARGHSGRPLRADPPEVACYVLINLAAVARVLVPALLPELERGAIIASGLLWTAAYVAFVAKFLPILTAARADGRPG